MPDYYPEILKYLLDETVDMIDAASEVVRQRPKVSQARAAIVDLLDAIASNPGEIHDGSGAGPGGP